MNYIYDIILNFQEEYYDFFEWKRNDNIKNIIKIPLYRVTDQDIKNLKYNKIKVSEEFLSKIKIDNKNYKKNICLVSNGKISIALLFNQRGDLIKKSSLIFEEEEEAIDIARNLPITNIKYIKNIKRLPKNKLRLEKEKKEKLIKYIKSNNNYYTLKYLYYEYYQKEIENISKIKETLIKEVSKEWNTKQNDLYKLVNIFTKTK